MTQPIQNPGGTKRNVTVPVNPAGTATDGRPEIGRRPSALPRIAAMKADLCDPQQWIEAPVLHDQAAILERIPQRYELALLHGIFFHDVSKHKAIGFHDAKATDFWVRGHIPGRPLMPGVIMIEISAQLCSWLGTFADELSGHFMGFAVIDHARFRRWFAAFETGHANHTEALDSTATKLGRFAGRAFADLKKRVKERE